MDEYSAFKIPAKVGAALAVCAGKYGNGEERITKLEAAGFTLSEVEDIQDIVNVIIKKGGY